MGSLPASAFPTLRPYEAVAQDPGEECAAPAPSPPPSASVPLASATGATTPRATLSRSLSLRRRSAASIPASDIELAASIANATARCQSAGEGSDELSPRLEDRAEEEADIYDIAKVDDGAGEGRSALDPFAAGRVGIPASYFGVGLMIGGGSSLLYPVLIVRGGATSSLMAASHAAIGIFWSYKILFGFLSDCLCQTHPSETLTYELTSLRKHSFPIFGYKRRPYMIFGWLICAAALITLAGEGNDIDPRHLVITLSFCNFGYVWADTAADGFMVTIAHREPIEKRGKTQTFCFSLRTSDSMMKLGQLVVNVVLLLGMSGPEMNCPGYEPDPDSACSTDEAVLRRVDPTLLGNHTMNSLSPIGKDKADDEWCHEKCPRATFWWDLSIPRMHTHFLADQLFFLDMLRSSQHLTCSFALSICFVIVASVPLYLRLNEEKVEAEPRGEFLRKFWNQIQRRAAWQIILYGVLSHITLGVHNAAKPLANYAWLELTTFQQQIMLILEKLAFIIGLGLVRKYALNVSWKQLVMLGTCLVLAFNSLYFLIIFDVWRSTWFYVFTDVSTTFMYTLNSFLACMVEVAEPGFEAITYSLITAASNVVWPLSSVVSYQLLAFFPSLNDQEGIGKDTPQIRGEFAALQVLVIFVNLSSLLTLPLLPRQKRETRELVAGGERSLMWGTFVIVSLLSFLCYSTFVTLVTVKYHDSLGCLKILGGGGCTEQESSIPALLLVSSILTYCYGTNFYLSYWPILKGDKKFQWSLFV
ncbi:LOW QUALITY PROTEIN: hypothetical protein ACHAWF_007051 [Thalassiosira exigua]